MIQKNTILIVDDIQSNLILLNKILTDEGYNVISAPNGDDAIKLAQENKLDLILLDIMMPKKDGFTVFEELKTFEKTANTPVIFITVINNDTDTLKAFEMGAVDYITKPFTPTELRIRIKTQIALVNAHKSNSGIADFSTNTVREPDKDPITDLSEKFGLIKNNIQDLEHAQLNPQEKENINQLYTQASEILVLLKKLDK
ncbi:MAG: response regulator [Bacteroidales bacterium]|nr:response regulator [Bacteroidales bacterium]